MSDQPGPFSSHEPPAEPPAATPPSPPVPEHGYAPPPPPEHTYVPPQPPEHTFAPTPPPEYGYEPPSVNPAEQPLPVCDYTSGSEAPCEEPTRVKRWSGAAVVTGASLGAVFGGLLVAAALVWAFGLTPGADKGSSEGTSSAPRASSEKLTISASGASLDVAEAVAKKVVPSVVNITIQRAVVDPFSGTKAYQDLGNGSGIMIRSNGYVLTNNHVVKDADRILVSVGVDKKTAKVVGVDPSTDIAVIKVDGTGYSAIETGSSQNLRVGQWVMAVGSPFGLEKTVTSGIISALQRSEQTQSQSNYDITTYTNLIQTDAAINPGNSGGALVDDSGKLIGLNSLIQSPSGTVGVAQSAGIGFAIPVDFAMDIAGQLIATGRATHPYLGVSCATVDESIAAQFGLNVKSGAFVRFVSPGSPADKAGIKAGDIITKIGDVEVTDVSGLFSVIRDHKIGSSAPIELVRTTQHLTVNATFASDSAATSK
jgi:putative serine protease PepD